MFIGKYYHSLEEKGRISLPKPFREKNSEWVISRGLDGGLFVYTKSLFVQEAAALSQKRFTKKKNRDFVRLMTNEAYETTSDSAGRVQLPDHLIALAGLEKAVVIVGSLDRIEIWDRARYHTYIDALESQAESIAEGLENNVE
jgi:MraZ protein